MAELVAIVGNSGTGKSTSLRNLNPEETFIISTTGKPLPFKGFKSKYTTLKQDPNTKEWSGNYYVTSNVDKIGTVLKLINNKLTNIKTVVLDDMQYLMSFEAMDRAKEKSYDKFVEIAQHMYSVFKEAMNMRSDLIFVVCTHSENAGDEMNPKLKMKTVGKMLDNVIVLEGLFTYVLYTTLSKNEDGVLQYQFMTNTDGTNTAKSPFGCFEDLYIDNDLKYVIEKIREYNEG